jgi:hypothetical protein
MTDLNAGWLSGSAAKSAAAAPIARKVLAPASSANRKASTKLRYFF